MKANLLRLFITVVSAVILSSSLHSQVRVERSKSMVIIGGAAYYIHIVDSSQTLYSISKAYNVSSEVITRENPSAVYGIRIGQALKIPVVSEDQGEERRKDTERYYYHILQKGESVYSLSRKYDVETEEIIEANPGIDIHDIPVGEELAIPRRQFRQQSQYFQTDEPGIILHRVEEGENYSSLSRKYNVSIRDIRRLNHGLLFPRPGDLIRIPSGEKEEEDDTTVVDTLLRGDEKLTYLFDGSAVDYTPVENLDGRINVLLMLPLMLEENSRRSYIDSTEYDARGRKKYKVVKRDDEWIYPLSELFIEFYEGALLAVEALKQKGLDIELQVFDTMRDSSRVGRFLENSRLRDVDLIVGPVYPGNLEQVATYARRHRIPIVSPLASHNTEVLRLNPYLFKVQPSKDVVEDAMAEEISNYYNYNLVMVHSDTAWNAELSGAFKDKIYRRLRLKVPFSNISLREVYFTSRSTYNDTINIIEHALAADRPNLIILASDDNAVMSKVIVNVHNLLRSYDIKLIGYPDIRWLDNLDPMYFYELGLMMFTPNWVDYQQEDVRTFLKKYREYFEMEPPVESSAWQSYDIMYYFISGLAIHGSDFMYRPSMHKPDLLQVDYSFERTGLMNGFENNRLYLLRYSPDLKVEFLDKSN